MRFIVPVLIACTTFLTACHSDNKRDKHIAKNAKDTAVLKMKTGYAEVNGLRMYYEVYGEGQPLVLIHGGGSTIQSSFGKMIPLLSDRQVIAMELQAHGRTADRSTPLSFAQDADDVAALMHYLGVERADILGFSNGGQTAMELAMRHNKLIRRLVIVSAFYKRSGTFPQFWSIFENAKFEDMPHELKTAFLEVNNDTNALRNMFNRDVERMFHFKGWSDEKIAAIQSPTLIMNGTADVGTAEHAIEMQRRIAGSELVILPGSHGLMLGEVSAQGDTLQYKRACNIIRDFLDSPFHNNN